jgi:ligand-binding SRPBCC domain-containing protein
MTCIELETIIRAPIKICFDLSRSIELHQISTASTKEKAIRGRLTGLCEKGNTIVWRAKHFGIYQLLTVEITDMITPIFFEDRMVKGAFKSIRHRHFFSDNKDHIRMKDIFEYEVPAQIPGRIFDKLILKRYMTNLLLKRNQSIKEFAEGNWQHILSPTGGH